MKQFNARCSNNKIDMKFINKIAILQKVLVELKTAETDRHVLQGSTLLHIFDTLKLKPSQRFIKPMCYIKYNCNMNVLKVIGKQFYRKRSIRSDSTFHEYCPSLLPACPPTFPWPINLLPNSKKVSIILLKFNLINKFLWNNI